MIVLVLKVSAIWRFYCINTIKINIVLYYSNSVSIYKHLLRCCLTYSLESNPITDKSVDVFCELIGTAKKLSYLK